MSEEGLLSSRSLASSLLTVSDLEEDLRAASAFLTNKRSSSVFTDSLDDLCSGLDDISSGFPLRNYNFEGIKNEKYEKDIREIVEYFEKKCMINRFVICVCSSCRNNVGQNVIFSSGNFLLNNCWLREGGRSWGWH